MKIIFFSEIRWDYLRTRKQQIISRFPKDWKILFFEPFKNGKRGKLSAACQENIYVKTMPLFFKNFKFKPLQLILSFKMVRFFVLLAGWFLIRWAMRHTGFDKPDLIMVSNIYAAPFVKALAGTSVPVIYDMNDDHLAFPNTPAWAQKYFESIYTVASCIVMPSESMREILPIYGRAANYVVTNGVDYAMFEKKSRIILYVGAMSEWIDIELLEKVAKSFPNEILRLIGPVSVNVDELRKYANVEFVDELDRRLLVEQIKNASVCLIPFRACKLTAHTQNINKVFEYLAAGKPVVSIVRPQADFEISNRRFIYHANSHDQFIDGVAMALVENDPILVLHREYFAISNDWNIKAKEMIEIINEVTA